jgi:DNA-binding protein H-NS
MCHGTIVIIRKPAYLIFLRGEGPFLGEAKMARPSALDNMSYAELTELELRIARLKVEKQNEARNMLRERMNTLAKDHGFNLRELMDGRRKGKGKVAVKYRDPKNRENTWTGRGRMPRWMVAATKGREASKDDFLI